jgi:predicted transcriptional regulator
MMPLQHQYQENFTIVRVLTLLDGHEKMLREICGNLDCSQSTAENPVKILLEMNKIKRRNVKINHCGCIHPENRTMKNKGCWAANGQKSGV